MILLILSSAVLFIGRARTHARTHMCVVKQRLLVVKIS